MLSGRIKEWSPPIMIGAAPASDDLPHPLADLLVRGFNIKWIDACIPVIHDL
jgi:hypothetical protein